MKNSSKILCIVICFLSAIAYVSNNPIKTKNEYMKSHILGVSNDLLDAYELGDPDPIEILLELDSMSDDIVDENVFFNLSTFFYIFHLQLMQGHDFTEQMIYDKVIFYSKRAGSGEMIFIINLCYGYMIPLRSFRSVTFEREKAIEAFRSVLNHPDATPDQKIWALSYIERIRESYADR